MPRTGNEIPIVESTISVIEYLSALGEPASMAEIVETCKISRSSAYRIIKTLEQADWVQVGAKRSHYRIGSGLKGITNLQHGPQSQALRRTALPHMDRLALISGQTVKLAVIDQGAAHSDSVVQGHGEFAIVLKPNTHVSLHLGAAGKMLLSSFSDSDIEAFLSKPLQRFTANTIVDADTLRREITSIRELGWSEDRGEKKASTGAYAAPIYAKEGQMQAALSIVFLIDHPKKEKLRPMVVEAASTISMALREHEIVHVE